MCRRETLLQITAIFLLVSGILMQAFSLWIRETIGTLSYEYIFSVISFSVFGFSGILLYTVARAQRQNGLARRVWSKIGYYNGDSE